MNKIRFILSIWVCRFLILLGKLFGKKGSSTPGIYALKICPDILKRLSLNVRYKIIAVCGTNGKTTTNNLICSILEKKGYRVICNKVGANMLPGVVTAFVKNAGIFGTKKSDYAAIEMDEASTVVIFKHFLPDIMAITNLFRDQLDRYGEIDKTIGYIKNAISMTKNTELVINGDDPLCAAIAKDCDKKVKTFGISEDLNINLNETKEGQFCLFCGEKLNYNYYHYSQLGDYYCSQCAFSRPLIDYEAKNLNINEGLKFTINNKVHINVNYKGFYNIYNILCAFSVCDNMGIDLNNINEILYNYKPQIGRMEKFFIKKPVILNLSKNPAGFNQGIFAVLSDKKTKDLVIMINDNAQDGTDISWLWDVDFEKLNDDSVKEIAFTGIRRYDLSVRFKYADIGKGNKVYDDLKTAVLNMIESDSEVLYLLVNYTAIFKAQDILKELEAEFRKGGKGKWK